MTSATRRAALTALASASTLAIPSALVAPAAAVNGAAIFLKSGAAKFPSLAGLGCQPCG
jgi:hypothetical protein